MKITVQDLRRYGSGLAAMAAVFLIGVSFSHLTYAASGSLSLNPSSGSATVGSTLSVTIHENSSSDAAVGVDAYVNYSSNLQFVSATTTAPFNIAPPDSASGGTVEIVRGYAGGTPPTGDQVVSVVTFNVLSAGTGTVSFNNGKSSLSPASGSGNLLVTSSGGSYTLSAASSGGSGGSTGGTTTSGGSNATPAAPAASTAKGTSVSVTPSTTKSSGSKTSSTTSAAPVTVPNNGSVAVDTPISVQPATVQTDGVKKVEYFLAGKLVDTETKAPYKYNIDTSSLKNGSYKLVSKTYYSNGLTKQSSQNILVRNTQGSRLWLYLLVAGLVALAIAGINLVDSGGGPFRYLLGGLHHPASTGPSLGSGWVVGDGGRSDHEETPITLNQTFTDPKPEPTDFSKATEKPDTPSVETSLKQLAEPDRPEPGVTVAPEDDKQA
jgi:hypothetical protein